MVLQGGVSAARAATQCTVQVHSCLSTVRQGISGQLRLCTGLGAAGAGITYSSDTLKECMESTYPMDKEASLQQLAHLRVMVIIVKILLVVQYPHVQQAVPSEDSEGTSHAAPEACRLKLEVRTTSHVSATIVVSQGTLTCKLQLTVSSGSWVHAEISVAATQQQAAQPAVGPWTVKLVPIVGQPAAAFLPALVWPTPKAAAWTDIEVVACRAAMLLHFLQLSAEQPPQPAAQDLRDALVRLLCCLLLGHLSNLKLDVQLVFCSAFVPVMQELEGSLHDEHGRTDLGVAFMRRLITDPTLMNMGLISNPFAYPVKSKVVVVVWGFLGKWEQPMHAAVAVWCHAA